MKKSATLVALALVCGLMTVNAWAATVPPSRWPDLNAAMAIIGGPALVEVRAVDESRDTVLTTNYLIVDARAGEGKVVEIFEPGVLEHESHAQIRLQLQEGEKFHLGLHRAPSRLELKEGVAGPAMTATITVLEGRIEVLRDGLLVNGVETLGSTPRSAQPYLDGDDPGFVDLGIAGSSVGETAEPVLFDIDGDGTAERMSLTLEDPADGWLVLDRNGNGFIDDGTELFGRHAEQPAGPRPNGYLALAQFDGVEKGGNEDGLLSAADAIFPSLALWFDRNKNGFSELEELRSLSESGIQWIGLHHREVAGESYSLVRLESRRFVRLRAVYVSCP